jgi:flagellar hook-associated protein 3 FlgL
MRVADSMKYNLFMLRYNSVKSSMDRVQEQIATQKKVLRPSDDPVAFSTFVETSAESNLYNQFSRNIEKVRMYGSMYNTCFTTINDRLSVAKEIVISYASGVMDDSLRENAITQVKDIIEHLVTIGNSVMGDTYIFGGKESNVPPFQLNDDYSVTFNGSADVSEVFVDKNETEKLGISGNDVFYDGSVDIFETLKGLMDTLENDDPSQTSQYTEAIGDAMTLISKNTAYNGNKVQQMEAMIDDNKIRQLRLSTTISETMDADLAQLSAEYNSLSTVYQALIYSMSKIENLGILNYLK